MSTAYGQAWRIDGAMSINNVPLPPPLSLEVETNNLNSADHWSCVLALPMMPPAFGWRFWSGQTAMEVDLRVSVVPAGAAPNFRRLILGLVDDIDLEADQGEIHLCGRDKTALFIETTSTAKFPQQFASDVATQFATSHGLQAQVTATQRKIGEYYQGENARLSDIESQWDILRSLADFEGFDVFVQGNTLYFQPPAAAAQAHILQYNPIGPSGNFNTLRCRRSLLLAGGVHVTTQSWHSKQKKTNTSTATSASASATPQTFTYRAASLQTDQTGQLAQHKTKELSRHERQISWSEPGDLTLTPRTPVQLQGTGSDWDQTYTIDSIHRRVSPRGGFLMDVTAKVAA